MKTLEPHSVPSKGNSKKHLRSRRVAEMASAGVVAILSKIVLLGLVDALSVYSALMLANRGRWIILVIVVGATVIVNLIYWRPGALAAKYLTPGLVFLLVFQIFAITYSTYIAFTNYGTGHNGTKEQAISSLLQSALTKKKNSATYGISVVQCGKSLGFLVSTESGEFSAGDAHTPLHKVTNISMDSSGKAVSMPGCSILDFSDILKRQGEITQLAIPISGNDEDGMLQTSDGLKAYVYQSSLIYSSNNDTMTDTKTNRVYRDTGNGAFTASNGQELKPGWRINVGWANFAAVFTSKEMRGPFSRVMIWTLEFSILSVLSTFVLGLFLAVVFNNPRMRGRRIYRSILILPYAFPGFLSALIWAGLLNTKFGFFNQVLFRGASIPWLQSPTLAKVAILVVNLWLGFPYMFLVCMGALQSIPDELSEAAEIDGASAWQTFRLIKFPLLLVSIAPLLISSFALNFNNFNLIYMLTSGGPISTDTNMNIGSTDILISMVYKIAFVGADKNYGLASAFAIIIFLFIAVVSAIGFRTSKSLEELN